MKKLLEYEDFKSSSKDIVITIPKNIRWEDYEKELKAAEDGEVLNFKVAHFPKTEVGCKCYVVYDGFLKGYMIISGLSKKDFKCTTTGREWKGKFIERTGKFYKVNEVPMKGFQGFRYFENLLVK